MVDLSPLRKVVEAFADDPASGEIWTRERSAPSTTTATGALATALASSFPFTCFVNPLGGKAAVKGEPAGEKLDESVTLYAGVNQKVNGLVFPLDFIVADETTNTRGDIVRRADGRAYEVIAAIPWKPGQFWEITARWVPGG